MGELVEEQVTVSSPQHLQLGRPRIPLSLHGLRPCLAHRETLADGSPSLPRRKAPTASVGAPSALDADPVHTITLHHHISMTPLHLLPKYCRIPVIVTYRA